MSEAAIISGLTPLFREVLDLPDLVLTAETRASEVPGWDSITHLTLVVAVEQRFSVHFNTAEIEELQNVGDLARLIAQKQS